MKKEKILQFINYNKGLILFYIIFTILILIWCNYVEKTNDKISEQKEAKYSYKGGVINE